MDGDTNAYPNCFPFTYHDSGEYTDGLTITDHFAVALAVTSPDSMAERLANAHRILAAECYAIGYSDGTADIHSHPSAYGVSDSMPATDSDEQHQEVGRVDKVPDGPNRRNK